MNQIDLFGREPETGPSLAEARRRFFAGIELGDPVVCPCCEAIRSKDVRTIHSRMAAGLIVGSRLEAATREPFSVAELARRLSFTGTTNPVADFAKLRWWGLIEAAERSDALGRKTSGFYRVTDKGRAFVAGRVTVPQRVIRWNKRVERFDGPEITIRDALGEAFDYDRLIGMRRELGRKGKE